MTEVVYNYAMIQRPEQLASRNSLPALPAIAGRNKSRWIPLLPRHAHTDYSSKLAWFVYNRSTTPCSFSIVSSALS